MSNIVCQAYESYLAHAANVQSCSFWVEFHPTDQNKLVVLIAGEAGTIHQNALYKVEFTFTNDYPKKRPEGIFCTPLPYHCNIGADGKICLDYYNAWGSSYTGQTFNHLLESLSDLVHNQNPDSCLRSDIGKEQKTDLALYEQKVKAQAQVCKKAFS